MKKKLPKKKGNWKRAAAVGVVALAASGMFWYIANAKGIKIPVPSYRAMQVIDGDTFDTEERQRIRLTNIDAPELDKCDGPEAKKTLEKLVMNKNLYVKVIFRDSNRRLISHVFNDEGSVGVQMLRAGMAYYLGSTYSDPDLAKASEYARNEKIGIYSSKCTQTQNSKNPKCVIKGNYPGFTLKNGTYHFPGCDNYTLTKLELFKGDRWFCTESEAQKAGFTKGADCRNKVWK